MKNIVSTFYRTQHVLIEMNAENNQESVVAEEVFVRTTQVVTIVSVLVDTEWTKEETSASVSSDHIN